MPAHAFDKTLRARAGLHRRRGRGRREAGALGGIPRHKDREAEGRARGFLRDRQAVNPPAENAPCRRRIYRAPLGSGPDSGFSSVKPSSQKRMMLGVFLVAMVFCLFPLTFISSPLSNHLLPSFPTTAWLLHVVPHLYPSGVGRQPLRSPCPPSSLALALLRRDHIHSCWRALSPNLCHTLWPVIALAPEPPALDHKRDHPRSVLSSQAALPVVGNMPDPH